MGVLRLRPGGDRQERVRRPHRRRPAADPAERAVRRRLRGDRRRRAEGRRLEPRDRRAVRGVLGQPAGDRVVVRADPRAQQHQHRPADGRSRHAAPARARRVDPARPSSPRGHDAITALIIESGGLLPFCARLANAARSACPPTGTAAAADEPHREDPRRQAAARPGQLRRARRRRAGQGRRRLLARVHHRTGRQVPGRRVRRRLRAQGPIEVRGVRGSPDLRHRRRLDGQVRRQDREAARAAARVRGGDRRAQLLGDRRRVARHLPPGRPRAADRSGRLRPGHRLAHLHGRRVRRARVGRRRDRVRRADLLGVHADRGARVDPLRADRQLRRRARPRRT